MERTSLSEAAIGLELEVAQARQDLQQALANQGKFQQDCRHGEWIDLAKDYRPAIMVPMEITIFHRRQCCLCGKIEETSNVRVTEVEPIW